MRGLMLLALLGCATAKPAEGEPARSSVDALLRRAGELRLTGAQVARLQEIDDAREARAERLRMDLRHKRQDLTSGDNLNYSANRGSADGVRGYRAEALRVRRRLAKLDAEALERAEAELDADQLTLGRSFVERWRFEWSASRQDDGE